MPNAKDNSSTTAFQKILVVGNGGSGKTFQMRTLPGRKFAYLFDPAALLSLQGADIDYEQYLPDVLELDSTLKGFNKNAKSDKPSSSREPTVYVRWVEDLNKRYESGFFKDYSWLCIDSLTLLANAVMDRQLWLNNRYGDIEDIADYRVTGSKIADVFRSICSIPINLYCTGHLNSFQDEKTKRIATQIQLPGKARNMLPLLFSNIWEARSTTEDKAQHVLLTRPEPRGFDGIRTTLQGLTPVVDVTVRNLAQPESFGIGALLKKAIPSSQPSSTTSSQTTVANGVRPASASTQPAR
jgi:hypothetical protein